MFLNLTKFLVIPLKFILVEKMGSDVSSSRELPLVFIFGGLSSVAVTRPPCNDKDMGLNPAATRYKKNDIGRPPYRR